jgi:hypothetical protein
VAASQQKIAMEYVFDQTETVGTVWMGLTFNCCRCHDHKFDPISQRDYFSMYSFFNQTPVNGGGGDPAMAPNIQVGTIEQKKEIAGLDQKIVAHTKAIAARRKVLAQGQAKWESEQLEARVSLRVDATETHRRPRAAADFGIAAGSIGPGERQAARSR